MEQLVRIAAGIILGLWAASQAFAGQGPCAEDVAKFCQGVQRGQGRIIECMKEHENDLSPACKAHIAEMQEKRSGAREVCAGDRARFCKDVQPGQGRIIRCMKEHENDLSPECRAKLQEQQHKRNRQ